MKKTLSVLLALLPLSMCAQSYELQNDHMTLAVRAEPASDRFSENGYVLIADFKDGATHYLERIFIGMRGDFVTMFAPIDEFVPEPGTVGYVSTGWTGWMPAIGDIALPGLWTYEKGEE